MMRRCRSFGIIGALLVGLLATGQVPTAKSALADDYGYGAVAAYLKARLAFQSSDYENAIYWYEIAGSLGNETAVLELGHMYYQGYGVERDDVKAVYYYMKAANMGSIDAMCNLAVAYRRGVGVQQSNASAEKWEREVRRRGDVCAPF